ncbi:MFS transporter [Streptomyces sp. NPDC004647]|uniref:MFS transporter n=1 Tax=Streptomyces sp. NPDC004647 TaxID=3154671 RepID=UPI0033BDB474
MPPGLFGVGAVGTGAFGSVSGLLLVFYYTDTLRIPPGGAVLVLVIGKAWEVLAAPVAGRLSDRSAARRGRRTRWLVGGALGLAAGFALLFSAPQGTVWVSAVWATVASVVASIGYACFQASYVALPGELTDDPAAMTRLLSWRTVCLIAGILLAGAGASLLVDAAGGGRSGYLVMGVTVATLIAATTLVTALTAGRAALTGGVRSPPQRPRPTAGRRPVLGNRAFVLLAGSYVVQTLAIAMALAGIPYVASYRLQSTALTSVLFAAALVPALFLTPVWRRAAERFGPVTCLAAAVTAYAAAALALSLGAQIRSTALVVCCSVVFGCCFAAQQLIPFALLTRLTARPSGGEDGERGALAGAWTGAETAGNALGPALFAAVLATGSFAAGKTPGPHGPGQTAIVLGVGLVPAVFLLASVPLLLLFSRTMPDLSRTSVGTRRRTL